jgi:hypothetical protein
VHVKLTPVLALGRLRKSQTREPHTDSRLAWPSSRRRAARRTPARLPRRGGRASRTPPSWVGVLRAVGCAWPPLTAAGRKYLFVRQVPAAKVSERSAHAHPAGRHGARCSGCPCQGALRRCRGVGPGVVGWGLCAVVESRHAWSTEAK